MFLPSTNVENAKDILENINPLKPYYSRLWIPKKNTCWRKAGKIEIIREVLFPSYLFVDTESYQDLYDSLRKFSFSFPSLLLGHSEEHSLKTVTSQELEWINALSDEQISDVQYVDQRVHFTHGPMIGMDGYVRKVDRRKQQLMLEMEFFQRTMRIWVAFNDVERE